MSGRTFKVFLCSQWLNGSAGESIPRTIVEKMKRNFIVYELASFHPENTINVRSIFGYKQCVIMNKLCRNLLQKNRSNTSLYSSGLTDWAVTLVRLQESETRDLSALTNQLAYLLTLSRLHKEITITYNKSIFICCSIFASNYFR